MNKVESLGTGFLAGLVVMFVIWTIWTSFVFEYLMIVLKEWGHDMTAVEHEFYWMMVGLWLIWGIHSATRVYHYARRGDKV